MVSIYISGAEVSSGKSALCIGLGNHFRAKGSKVGYMKPVNINCHLQEGMAFDEDIVYAKEAFGMAEPPGLLGPVALTPAKQEQLLRGPEVKYDTRLVDAFNQLATGYDVMILEGGRSLYEGYIADLPPRRVAELLKAPVLVVLRYDEVTLVDCALMVHDYFGAALMGVVINAIPRARMDQADESVKPYLTRQGISMFGLLPKDPLLAAPTVTELAEGLNAEFLCGAEWGGEMVEHMLVGAMSVEAALPRLRRTPNKAVITGGDRAEIQLAALETPTRCLILTGNLYPSPKVLYQAEELNVPVLLTSLDTLDTIELVREYYHCSRFHHPQKIKRFAELLDEHFNFTALYESLGLPINSSGGSIK
jgi:BioD-like phosphotransacetylase family protein